MRDEYFVILFILLALVWVVKTLWGLYLMFSMSRDMRRQVALLQELAAKRPGGAKSTLSAGNADSAAAAEPVAAAAGVAGATEAASGGSRPAWAT
ncbi:MAG: hypothetical protein GX617_11245, partial [Lentisphaerae bacterium]|nr:hypothetical protein [Lentisphaerota bacterium]